MEEYRKGKLVRITEVLDKNHDCSAEIVKLIPETGEYLLEMISGDDRGLTKVYSAADFNPY